MLGTTNGSPSNWDLSSLIVPSLDRTSETNSTSSPTSSILSSGPTFEDFSPASSAYSQLSTDLCTSDKCQRLLTKNKELLQENKWLENTVRLIPNVKFSNSKLRITLKHSTMFNELLKKLDWLSSTATPTPADPIITVYMAVDAYPLIDPNDVGNPRALMFRESDWRKKAEKSRCILDFNGDENVGGPLKFLVDEDGMVVSVERQGDMHQKGRSVLMVLKLANRKFSLKDLSFTAPKLMPVVQDTSVRVNRSAIKISNPLLSRKNTPSQPSTQLPQLSPQLLLVDEPIIPAFIWTPADNPMHTELVCAPGVEIPNSKKKREVNPQSILRPSKSNTASEDDRKPWNNKMMLVKMAQQAAFKNVTGPSDATPSN
ncbi:hypothetical protein EV702DRAFT_1045181 [Suillus placidus]|uniref:Uncharacterized protein n=1 Tax=Suillus placidus TaxID=48579 RepID=A0A9P6ZW14_9AGAM|nr:hypothetical protein EV702DRAFT_1045181 [Suillus placidus]